MLCYHAVIAEAPREGRRFRAINAVTLSELREQLEIICRFFAPVSAFEVLKSVTDGSALPPRSVLVTFDDGFRNNLTYAAPELEKYGVPALINIATGYIGQAEMLWSQEIVERILSWKYTSIPSPDGEIAKLPRDMADRLRIAESVREACKRLPNDARKEYLAALRNESLELAQWHHELYDFMSWDEVRRLNNRGFEIGSHTVEHPILTRLSAIELEQELLRSKATVEREVGKQCPYLAYPNGRRNDFSDEVVAKARKAGYRLAFTLMGTLNRLHLSPLQIDRLWIAGGLDKNVFHAMVSGLLSLKGASRRASE